MSDAHDGLIARLEETLTRQRYSRVVVHNYCNVGKTRGGQAGLKRVRTRSGRYGMAGWSGTASLVPR
jgi:hypothetical protein